MNWLRSAAWICALFLLTSLPLRAQSTQPATTVIALAGDSTMSDSSGWGPGFAKCLTPDTKLLNLAKNGRSSKSFINEGWWKKLLEAKPNYVLIQFGHNDQPGHSADKVTDPNTTYRQYMTQYVDDARAAGIRPVLVTSLSRRQWGSDGKIHSTLIPNVEVVKQIAKEKDVPLIDLHARSIELYEKLGKAEIDTLSPSKPSTKPNDDGTTGTTLDNTHLNPAGQDVIGRLMAEQIQQNIPELANHIQLLAGAK